MGRPRLPISTYGTINVRELSPGAWRARTQYRFPDGKRRQVERIRPGRTGARAATALRAALVDLVTPASGELKASTRLAALGERFVAEKRDSGLAAGSVATYEQVLKSIDRAADRRPAARRGDARPAAAVLHRRREGAWARPSEDVPIRPVGHIGHGGPRGRAPDESGQPGRPHPPPSVTRVERLGAGRQYPGSSRQSCRIRSSRSWTSVAILAFMVLTGCRVGEALGLLWSDVDFAGGQGDLQRHSSASAGWRCDEPAPRQDRSVHEDHLGAAAGAAQSLRPGNRTPRWSSRR